MSDPTLKKSLPASYRVLRSVQKADQTVAKTEAVILIVLILGSILVSLTQIIIRNTGVLSFPELDTILRRSLLWITLLGASLATYHSRHFSLDIIQQILPSKLRSSIQFIALLITVLVTTILAISTARFVFFELNFAGFGAATSVLIMPISFAVITCRLLLYGWHKITTKTDNLSKDSPKTLSTSRTTFSGDNIADPNHQLKQKTKDS